MRSTRKPWRRALALALLVACGPAQAEPPDPDHPSSPPPPAAPAVAPDVAPDVGCNPDGCVFGTPPGVVHDGFRYSASSAPGTGSVGWWEHVSWQPTGTYFVAQLCNGTAPYDDAECGPPSPVYRVPEPPRRTVEDIIRAAFGAEGERAVRVARCESGLNPRATNGQYLGLFQMGRYHYWRFDGGAWSDPEVNARAAAALWRDSGGWGPWECRP